MAVGRHVGLRERELIRLRFAALVHDLGKTGIEPEILEKAGPLSEEEMHLVRRHPQTGYDQLVEVVDPEVAEAVLTHHELWDGSGYPNRLRGKGIPRLARIIVVADAYDVMTTGRSYRPKLSVAEAGEELARLAGRHFDPEVVDGFASLGRSLLSGVAGASFAE